MPPASPTVLRSSTPDATKRSALAASATLDGTVMDDDSPVTLANVQSTWSKQSGPGTRHLRERQRCRHQRKVLGSGHLRFDLNATDTALAASDTVVVTVSASDAGAGGAGGQGGAGGAGAKEAPQVRRDGAVREERPTKEAREARPTRAARERSHGSRRKCLGLRRSPCFRR